MRRSSTPRLLLVGALALAAVACSSPQPGRDGVASPSSAPAPSVAAPPPAPSAPPAEPAAVATTSAAAPASAPAASASAPPAEPPVAEVPVEVKNIGMHVGGGTNDAAEKAPIKRSVEPHMEDFAKCFAKVSDHAKGGDFGVDLRIEREGGKAKVSHPRTSLKGDGFKECVLAVFEAVDFEKPKGGTTTVSYSLRFTPKKDR